MTAQTQARNDDAPTNDALEAARAEGREEARIESIEQDRTEQMDYTYDQARGKARDAAHEIVRDKARELAHDKPHVIVPVGALEVDGEAEAVKVSEAIYAAAFTLHYTEAFNEIYDRELAVLQANVKEIFDSYREGVAKPATE